MLYENKDLEPMVQVGINHYKFENYVDIGRWNSYYHQIMEAMLLAPKTVLIVGIGDNIVGNFLASQQEAMQIYTFDFDKELRPDFCGNITEIGQILKGKKFDLVLCCQILEHIPFSLFDGVVQQLSTITDNVIISLPYSPHECNISCKLPFVGHRRIAIDIPRFYREYKFDGQHYWEIGRKGYSKRKVTSLIEQYFIVKKRFIATNNHYHLFFVLTVRHLDE